MRPAIMPQVPGFPLPWMLQGSSFGRPKTAVKTVRLTTSSESRSDSRAGSKVRFASSVTPIAIANGTPRSE